MNIDERWVFAVLAIIGGFILGALLAAGTRRLLDADGRRPAIRAGAAPLATFLFWMSVITGTVLAVGVASPETLEPIPGDILKWLPNALIAGLILLAGYAGGGALSVALAASVERAVGQRPAMVERTVRFGIMAIAVMLALSNLGVETTLLQILSAGAVFSLALSVALLAGLGGRDVASNVAGGRALRRDLAVGDMLFVGDVEGTISALRPALVVLDVGGGERVLIPFSQLMTEPFRLIPTSGHRSDAGTDGATDGPAGT